jgi:hypothetical protein
MMMTSGIREKGRGETRQVKDRKYLKMYTKKNVP